MANYWPVPIIQPVDPPVSIDERELEYFIDIWNSDGRFSARNFQLFPPKVPVLRWNIVSKFLDGGDSASSSKMISPFYNHQKNLGALTNHIALHFAFYRWAQLTDVAPFFDNPSASFNPFAFYNSNDWDPPSSPFSKHIPFRPQELPKTRTKAPTTVDIGNNAESHSSSISNPPNENTAAFDDETTSIDEYFANLEGQDMRKKKIKDISKSRLEMKKTADPTMKRSQPRANLDYVYSILKDQGRTTKSTKMSMAKAEQNSDVADDQHLLTSEEVSKARLDSASSMDKELQFQDFTSSAFSLDSSAEVPIFLQSSFFDNLITTNPIEDVKHRMPNDIVNLTKEMGGFVSPGKYDFFQFINPKYPRECGPECQSLIEYGNEDCSQYQHMIQAVHFKYHFGEEIDLDNYPFFALYTCQKRNSRKIWKNILEMEYILNLFLSPQKREERVGNLTTEIINSQDSYLGFTSRWNSGDNSKPLFLDIYNSFSNIETLKWRIAMAHSTKKLSTSERNSIKSSIGCDLKSIYSEAAEKTKHHISVPILPESSLNLKGSPFDPPEPRITRYIPQNAKCVPKHSDWEPSFYTQSLSSIPFRFIPYLLDSEKPPLAQSDIFQHFENSSQNWMNQVEKSLQLCYIDGNIETLLS